MFVDAFEEVECHLCGDVFSFLFFLVFVFFVGVEVKVFFSFIGCAKNVKSTISLKC